MPPENEFKKIIESNLGKVITWLLTLAFIAGGIYGATTYQTKVDAKVYQEQAEKAFVKKEVQIEKDKRDDERWETILKHLDNIDKALEDSHRRY